MDSNKVLISHFDLLAALPGKSSTRAHRRGERPLQIIFVKCFDEIIATLLEQNL